jgi:predicted XRE-type DNA-binding protein
MRRKTEAKLVRSSGNVFADLGFDKREAEHLLIRADLLIRLQEEIKRRGLKQSQAAKLLGITQPRVSDLVRSRLHLFSTDALIDLLARLGVAVRVVVSRNKVA